MCPLIRMLTHGVNNSTPCDRSGSNPTSDLSPVKKWSSWRLYSQGTAAHCRGVSSFNSTASSSVCSQTRHWILSKSQHAGIGCCHPATTSPPPPGVDSVCVSGPVVFGDNSKRCAFVSVHTLTLPPLCLVTFAVGFQTLYGTLWSRGPGGAVSGPPSLLYLK